MIFQTIYRKIIDHILRIPYWIKENTLTTQSYQGVEKGKISLVLQMLALGSQNCIYIIDCMSLRKSVSTLNFISLYLQWKQQSLSIADLKLKQYWDNKVIPLWKLLSAI